MSGYLLAIIGTVLLCAVLTAIVPEGKTANTIKGIAKLACLIVIIAPIPRFLQSTDLFDSIRAENESESQKKSEESVIKIDESFINYYCEMRIRNAEDYIREEILDKFAQETEVSFVWQVEDGDEEFLKNIRIMQIRVKTESTIKQEEKNAMWEYLTKNYCSEVLIE